MEPNLTQLQELQSNISELEILGSKKAFGNLFAEPCNASLNKFNLFVACFNSVPNSICERRINCKKAHQWFVDSYKEQIKNVYYKKEYFSARKNYSEYAEVFYFLFTDLIVEFDFVSAEVNFLFRKTEISKIEKMIEDVKKFRRQRIKNSNISVLVNTMNGIETQEISISNSKLCIADNYNDDFMDIHQTIVNRLSKRNDKGLVLLHGKPGTGKTSYIRYLISKVRKRVIFLPPVMAGTITSPNLISCLIENPNSIFVIEDAENIIMDRDKDGNSPVSALLNISDGLLSDCLNIQVICSFNTDISKIDSALMRKGRLIAKYEFKELSVGKANALSYKLGFRNILDSAMTLSSIYNQEERGFQQVTNKNSIGFRRINQN